MKFLVILVVTGCVIVNVHSKPLDSRDQLQHFFSSSKMAEMKKALQECAVKTLESKSQEFERFISDLKNSQGNARDIMSKIGTDEFDLDEYKEMCTDQMSKMNSFLLTMKNEFSKCADQDMMKIVDLALDFIKQLGDFQCNMSKEELSYLRPELREEVMMCVNQAKPKVEKCFIEKTSNALDSNDDSIQNTLCKIDVTATGECIKNAVAECGTNGSRGLNLMIGFMLKYMEQKLECPV